ncbi:hypothetical protein Pan44_21570 [Caulifigura coniformis]|uniref:Uncharacterized protein n=1 Tax=Caulifigura coniformis TaxID=2527983 RepID=A0A517SDC5_9PLAN|nr:hypothetical protein Pan44_21570 [Caulifigura coniformis]
MNTITVNQSAASTAAAPIASGRPVPGRCTTRVQDFQGRKGEKYGTPPATVRLGRDSPRRSKMQGFGFDFSSPDGQGERRRASVTPVRRSFPR